MANLIFSESTNRTGMYELFLDATKRNSSDYSKRRYARDANIALARFVFLAIKASQGNQFDDANHTDYPIITINVVANQQDYAFTYDASTTPNQILTIDRVEFKDSSGNWRVLEAYDEIVDGDPLSQTVTGTPTKYGQSANGIWLNNIPSYNVTAGLKVYTKRTGSYFLGDDTDDTKEAGIPHMFQEYLVFLPAYKDVLINIPSLASGYLQIVNQIEKDIPNYYFMRNQNQRKNMTPRIENTK